MLCAWKRLEKFEFRTTVFVVETEHRRLRDPFRKPVGCPGPDARHSIKCPAGRRARPLPVVRPWRVILFDKSTGRSRRTARQLYHIIIRAPSSSPATAHLVAHYFAVYDGHAASRRRWTFCNKPIYHCVFFLYAVTPFTNPAFKKLPVVVGEDRWSEWRTRRRETGPEKRIFFPIHRTRSVFGIFSTTARNFIQFYLLAVLHFTG